MNRAIFHEFMDSPAGRLLLVADDEGLTQVGFADGVGATPPPRHSRAAAHRHLEKGRRELDEYFTGRRRRFTVPLAPAGTEFQLRVWEQLRTIPFGTTRSYGEVAALLGQPTASRAVGAANGRNPLAIIVPCHRVIGASGKLVGYGGGVERKRILLGIEGLAGA